MFNCVSELYPIEARDILKHEDCLMNDATVKYISKQMDYDTVAEKCYPWTNNTTKRNYKYNCISLS